MHSQKLLECSTPSRKADIETDKNKLCINLNEDISSLHDIMTTSDNAPEIVDTVDTVDGSALKINKILLKAQVQLASSKPPAD